MDLDTKKVEISGIDDIPMERYTRYTVAWFAGMDDLANLDKVVVLKLVVEDEENRRAETVREVRIDNTGRLTPQFKTFSTRPVDETKISVELTFQELPTPLPNLMLLFRLSGTEVWQIATIRIPGEPASDSISLSTLGQKQQNKTEFIWDLRLSNVQQAGQYNLRLVSVSAISSAWRKFSQIVSPNVEANEINDKNDSSSEVTNPLMRSGNANTKGSVPLFAKPENSGQIIGYINNERVTAVAKRGRWYYISSSKDFGLSLIHI